MFAIIEGPEDESPYLYVYENPADVYRAAIKIVQNMFGTEALKGMPELDMVSDESVTDWYQCWHNHHTEVWVTLDVRPQRLPHAGMRDGLCYLGRQVIGAPVTS